jgi:hypothetical protein
MHFCISTEEIDVLVNFSLADDTRPAAAPDDRTAYMVCVVRADGWEGDVEAFATPDVSFARGGVHLKLGNNTVDYEGGEFHVRAGLETRPVGLDLTFRPVALPSLVNDIQLLRGAPWHWFVAPLLLANGRVDVGGRSYELCDAPSYHDHNWGYFRWGSDFAWTWGYGHASDGNGFWSVTFDRLTNRANTTESGRGLILWKGARQQRIFSGTDVIVHEEGLLRPKNVFKVPRALGLLAQGDATGIPARVLVTARSGPDLLELEFRSQNVCRILVPDDDLGLTIINEVSGEIFLAGTTHGDAVNARGRATFEFLDA